MKTNDEIGASMEPLRKQAAAPQEEAIAEIVSASHDQAEFGERAINFLRDFQHLEYGTKLYPAPQAVQAAVPEAIEQMAVDRYKVVPSHESMFHRWAVVAGSGTQQLYIGREGECQNMARKFMGAFLDGAFVAMQNAAPAHPAEGVPAQDVEIKVSAVMLKVAALIEKRVEVEPCAEAEAELLKFLRAAFAATQPAAQGMDAQTIVEKLPRYTYGYKSDEWGMNRCLRAYQDNAGTFLMRDEVLAALAAQAKQGGAANG
ncbi:hypothetical protein [Comamonas aquatica]|uniref:hypothetical protein n=1 Tax=Comamonas aquatica TaxID=225991 RepID=UPI00391DFBE3